MLFELTLKRREADGQFSEFHAYAEFKGPTLGPEDLAHMLDNLTHATLALQPKLLVPILDEAAFVGREPSDDVRIHEAT